MRFQRFSGYRVVDLGNIIFNRNTGMRQRKIIIGTERIEIIRIRLAGTIPAQQVVLKENTDFRNQRHIVFTGGGNLYRRNQVFLSIRTKHTDRKL